MKNKYIWLIVILFLFLNCKQKEKEILIFYASGKDFVNKPFIDKNDWNINLTSVLLHIRDITIRDEIAIAIYDKFFVELKSVDNEKIKLTEIMTNTPDKHKVISFALKKTYDYDFPGYSLILKGKAEKNNKKIDFLIKLNEEVIWEVKKEIEKENKKDNKQQIIELNFHLEHIFGSKDPIKIVDEEEGTIYDINENAVGFDFFVPFEKNGVINVSQEELMKNSNQESYKKLILALHNFAFVGKEMGKAIYTSSKF